MSLSSKVPSSSASELILGCKSLHLKLKWSQDNEFETFILNGLEFIAHGLEDLGSEVY